MNNKHYENFSKYCRLIMLSVFIVFTQNSCDYIVEKNHENYKNSGSAKTRIDIYKQEAKLLLQVSQNNLEILDLFECIRAVDTHNSVSHLTRKLEKVHFEISKNYDDLAEDKLISIPRYTRSSGKFEQIQILNYEAFIESNLKLILNKIENQIQLLDALGCVTNNIDFKILVIKDTQMLKSNIDEIRNYYI